MLEHPSRPLLALVLLIAVVTALTAHPIVVLIPPENCLQAGCCCAEPDADDDSCCRCDPTAPSLRSGCECAHRHGFSLDLGFIEPRLPLSLGAMSVLEIDKSSWHVVPLSSRSSRTIAPVPPPPRRSI